MFANREQKVAARPHEALNVAIIGCSGMGRIHAEMAANCGLNIAICADKSKKAASELAAKYGAKAMTDCLKPDCRIGPQNNCVFACACIAALCPGFSASTCAASCYSQ